MSISRAQKLAILFVVCLAVGTTLAALPAIFYIRSISMNILSQWLSSEMPNLQQGNILSSFTKLQNAIDQDFLLEGAKLVRHKDSSELISLGNPLETNITVFNFDPGQTALQIQSPYRTLLLHRLASNPELAVEFTLNLGRIVTILLFYILFSGLLISSLIIWIQLSNYRELSRREEIVLGAINDLLHQRPVPSLESALVPNLRQQWLGILNRMQRLVEAEGQVRAYSAQAEIAAQVSHDIRSPLAALEMVLKSLPNMAEDQRVLVRGSIGRIKDIANGLLQKYRDGTRLEPIASDDQGRADALLFSLLESLISEKRTQFRSKIGIEIDLLFAQQAYGIFASVNTIELKRLLSNLVNNAVEILGEVGRVTVALGQSTTDAIISVTDNGRGIPPEILSRLGQRGETHGKDGGSGLGLYHARTSVESWGGKLEIDSTVGLGTTVTIKIPLAKPPKWFVDRLKIESNSQIIILDDDSSVHRIWDGRFESARLAESGVAVIHFSTPAQLRSWADGLKNQKVIYLLDYELLGFSETGLDLIESLKIQNSSFLVTSRFEEPQIRVRCERLSVQLIPKSMAAYVPIELVKDKAIVDVILIDDDSLVHTTWQMAAQSATKRVASFSDPEDFFKNVAGFDVEIPVFVDVNLAHGVLGVEIAKRISDLGFSNIYLATGYAADSIQPQPFLKGVVGKDPPF